MHATTLDISAQGNFGDLQQNVYPGRGLILGRDRSGKYLVQVYWIMSRSENNRNRVFKKTGGKLYTEPADPTKVTNRANIFYNAMLELNEDYVVSNGNQTDIVIKALSSGCDLREALGPPCTYEDDPSSTPRITGVWSLGASTENPVAEIALLRRSPWGKDCDRFIYRYEHIAPGFGRGITTYREDGDPLPPFEGEPLLLPLGEAEDIAPTYWAALNADNRISLAVKLIDPTGASFIVTINRYEQVPQPVTA